MINDTKNQLKELFEIVDIDINIDNNSNNNIIENKNEMIDIKSVDTNISNINNNISNININTNIQNETKLYERKYKSQNNQKIYKLQEYSDKHKIL